MSKREEYQHKLQARLEEGKADLAKLKTQASESKEENKSAMQEKINDMEAQLEHFKGKLAELRDAGEDRWEELKDNIEATWHSWSESIRDMFSKHK